MYALVKGTGKTWDNTYREVMTFYVSVKDNIWYNSEDDRVILDVGNFLSFGKSGSLLYDIIILNTVGKGKRIESVVSLIEKFCTEIPAYDFVLLARKLLTDYAFDTDMTTILVTALSLVISGYNMGALVGVDSTERAVVFSPITMSANLYQLGVVLEVSSDTRVGSKFRLANGYKISPKKRARLLKYFAKVDKAGVRHSFKLATMEHLTFIGGQVHTNTNFANVLTIYNEISEDYFVPHDPLLYANLETSDRSAYTLVYGMLLSHKDLDTDLFKHRKVFVRDKGVVMTLRKVYQGILKLSLREFHSETGEEHYFLITYTLELKNYDIDRFLCVNMRDITSNSTLLEYESDFYALYLVMVWLGLLDKVDIAEEYFRDNVLDLKQDHFDYILNQLKIVHENAKLAMEDTNLVYETPIHWNYDTNSVKGNSDKTSHFVVEKRTIERHSRRLPKGQKPSPEAVAEAKRVFMHLEEGHTFVTEFERNQRVRLN